MSDGRPVNWAGNVVFSASEIHQPGTVAELQQAVSKSRRIRALGTRHSFSRIADTDGALVSVAGLPPVMEIDSQRATVKVAAGVRYGDLARYLHAAGYALANLGSLPHICVAGACATATHGSGTGNGNLATSVSAMEIVTAGGDIVTLRRGDGPDFAAAAVGLGAFGVITALYLDVLPTFDVQQEVYEGFTLTEIARCFEEVFASAYSVSVFTDWQSDRHNQLWIKRRTSDPAPADRGLPELAARPADGPRNPVPGMDPAFCTQQLGVPGPWHERLPHFRLGFTPSSGEELQTEYLLPRHAAAEALAVMTGLAGRVGPVLQIGEIRTVAADELWLSPFYQRDAVCLHFTWAKDPVGVLAVLGPIEDKLGPLGARPHWGKLFTIPGDTLAGLYPRWEDFAGCMARYDPAGKFRNAFLDQYFRSQPR